MTRIAERIGGQTDPFVCLEHVRRYQFALAQLKKGRVLDIACGSGYGADLLAQHGVVTVIGADVHEPSLRAARARYGVRVCFLQANGTALPFEGRSFSDVVTLETIEHIADDHGFLGEIARVLVPDGCCVLSTPDRSYSERIKRINPYHVREYSE